MSADTQTEKAKSARRRAPVHATADTMTLVIVGVCVSAVVTAALVMLVR
jgi:hypothetical protein